MFCFSRDNFWTKLKCFAKIFKFLDLIETFCFALSEIISGPNPKDLLLI
jgi:hypothetical protein